jgi:hypothetical protein
MDTSPTGTPLLAPKYVPFVLIAGSLVSVLAAALADPSPWTAVKAGKVLGELVPGVLGILSPGLRKAAGS